MTYEYMSGMGAPGAGDPVVIQSSLVTQGEASEDIRANARSEVEGMITGIQRLIDRVRGGGEGALAELQRALSHNDVVETIQAFDQYPDAHPNLSDTAADRQLWAQMRETFTLAQQVAEGNDPQQNRNAMIAVGVGAGALVLAGIAYLALKR